MRVVKAFVLVVACLAIGFSLVPLVAYGAIAHVEPRVVDPAPGSVEAAEKKWNVVCTYDGAGKLVSRVCSTGGDEACACPP